VSGRSAPRRFAASTKSGLAQIGPSSRLTHSIGAPQAGLAQHRIRHDGKQLQVRTDGNCRIELRRLEVGAAISRAPSRSDLRSKRRAPDRRPIRFAFADWSMRDWRPQECMVELYPPQRPDGKIATVRSDSMRSRRVPCLPARLKIEDGCGGLDLRECLQRNPRSRSGREASGAKQLQSPGVGLLHGSIPIVARTGSVDTRATPLLSRDGPAEAVT